MSTFYWVNGSGSWDATSTANWSNASGGASGFGPPTSADDVIFDAGSNTGTNPFTVTVTGTSSAPAVCNDFSTGGAGGALDGAMTLSLSATSRIDCYGSMTLPSTNFTWSGTSNAVLTFRATTTGKTVTTNGVALTLTRVDFDGVGGGWTLGSAITYGTGSQLTVINGTFNTGNFNVTGAVLAVNVSGSSQTINLGSSTITLSAGSSVNFSLPSNLTFNAGTSQITCSSSNPTFTGGGQTFYNVSFTNATAGVTTITGANTFNNLTQTSRAATGRRLMVIGANQTVSGTLTLGAANTAIRRIIINSDVAGTQRTITLNGTLATLADVDFKDIATAGTAGTWTGTRLGNGLNNSGITFDAAKTVYWNLAAGGNWSATAWATSSGGTPNVNNIPLAQDTAIIENTGLNTSATITYDSPFWVGELDTSTRTNAFTLSIAATISFFLYKNLTLSSATTVSQAGTTGFVFNGYNNTQLVTQNSSTINVPYTVQCFNGTVRLADNATINSSVTLSYGTLDLNDFDLTCNAFNSSNSNTRTIDFGTGEINLTGNNATIWNMPNATNFTYTGTPVVNCTYSGSTGTRTISGGNSSQGGVEANSISFNITAGSDIVATTGGNVYKNINFTGFTGTLTNTLRTFYGNLIISSGMSLDSGTNATYFVASSGTQQITTAGKTLDFPIFKDGVGSTLQLQDNLTMGSTRTFNLTAGTLDLSSGNRTLSCGIFNSTNSNTRAIAFGTGEIIVTGNNGNVFNINIATNFTYTGTSKVTSNYSGSVGTRNLLLGGNGGGSQANAVNLNVTAGTDTLVVGSHFLNINFTGFSGTLSNVANNIYGNLTISSGMTIDAGTFQTIFGGTSGTQQVTTNGKTLDFPITIDGVGGTVELQDALTMGSTRALTLTNGTFNANNYNVTAGSFSSSNSNTRTLTMGSGTWTIQGTGNAWNLTDPTNLTFNSDTSTISMTSASAKTFQGSSLTYYNLNQGGAGALTIVGDNTFNNITDSAQPSSILFTAGSTQTVSNFTVSGTPGNLITLASTVPGSIWYLTKTSGTVTVTYCDISDSDANGGATFNCINGVNSGNNTGWNFSSSQFSSGNFLAFF